MYGMWQDIDANSPKEKFDEFWNQMVQYVDLYVAFPKPRGKGGAPVINECTSSMHCGFEALARSGRVDLVSQLFERLMDGKDHLKGPNYSMWYERMMKWFEDENPTYCVDFFRMNSRACEIFVKEKTTSINSIVEVGKCIYSAEDLDAKDAYISLVKSIRGGLIEMDKSIHVNGEEDYVIDNSRDDSKPILKAINCLLDGMDGGVDE